MTDTLLVFLSAAALVGLAVTLVIRTVLAERAAGTGSKQARAFVRPDLVRRLDIASTALAVLAVIAAVLRVVFGTLG
ncbi:MAG: hypothetical protein ACREQ5_18390 [Candidatus Dormibacteria bacterium]